MLMGLMGACDLIRCCVQIGASGPPRLGPDDNIYWRNILARYAAHPAVIIDVSKEAASYGIGCGGWPRI